MPFNKIEKDFYENLNELSKCSSYIWLDNFKLYENNFRVLNILLSSETDNFTFLMSLIPDDNFIQMSLYGKCINYFTFVFLNASTITNSKLGSKFCFQNILKINTSIHTSKNHSCPNPIKFPFKIPMKLGSEQRKVINATISHQLLLIKVIL